MKRFRRPLPLYLAALCCLWAGTGVPARTVAAPAAPPPASPKAIKILSDAVLPPALEWASDVRWASERRVYLGLGKDGTIEANLEPAGLEPKEMIPGRDQPGGQWLSHRVAASAQYLAAAGPALSLSWRKLDTSERSQYAFEGIQAIDVRENRLAIVGALRDEKGRFGADGAIAWVGSLDKRLADLKPILYDVAGPGARMMGNCGASPVGAARFLADGSLVVMPGVQPGVHLYDAQGKLIRTWDTERLGIDTDCATLSDEQARHLLASSQDRQAWLNLRRTLDSLLPLTQGIGLVVRRVEKDHTLWDLKLLRRDGSVQTYSIPVEGANGSFYLHGDVRAGKLVFVLRETLPTGTGRSHPVPPRLILAEVPQG